MTRNCIITLFLLFFHWYMHGMYNMQKEVALQSSSRSSIKQWVHFLCTSSLNLGAFALGVLAFNPKHVQDTVLYKNRKKCIKHVFENRVTIIAPTQTTIKRDSHYIIINGECYDLLLKGTFFYKHGELVNKKGKIIDPLI